MVRYLFWAAVILVMAACSNSNNAAVDKSFVSDSDDVAVNESGGSDADVLADNMDSAVSDVESTESDATADNAADDDVVYEEGVIVTGSGPVKGVKTTLSWVFKGIPYAAPPVGSLRWKLPVKPEPWSTVRTADTFGNICPQYNTSGTVTGDEDCLTLNVWTPDLKPDIKRPVMVFIHGGGHEQGSGSLQMYDGTHLGGINVLVTINYRVGPFGFLAHPVLTVEGGDTASGDYGMHDQIFALKWVKDNIAKFGGDPERVMIFGQSAGSVSVCRLVASDKAAGLFSSASLMSGACVATKLADAEKKGTAMVTKLGCDAESDVAACMRSKSMTDVMKIFTPMTDGTGSLGKNSFDGVVDGYLLSDMPHNIISGGKYNKVPIIIGTTSEENGKNAPDLTTEDEYKQAVLNLFLAAGISSAQAPNLRDLAVAQYPVSEFGTPRAAYVALTTDVKFTCLSRRDSRTFVAMQDKPVFRYWFRQVPENGGAEFQKAGAFHGIDLFYLFETLPFLMVTPSDNDNHIMEEMNLLWTTFAYDGDVSMLQSVYWPKYDTTNEQLLYIDKDMKLGADPRGSQCDFWDKILGW